MNRFVQQFLQWWRAQDPQAQYIAAATNLADLELRLQAVERANSEPHLTDDWRSI